MKKKDERLRSEATEREVEDDVPINRRYYARRDGLPTPRAQPLIRKRKLASGSILEVAESTAGDINTCMRFSIVNLLDYLASTQGYTGDITLEDLSFNRLRKDLGREGLHART